MDNSAHFERKLAKALAEMSAEGQKYDEHNRLKGNAIGSRANKLHARV